MKKVKKDEIVKKRNKEEDAETIKEYQNQIEQKIEKHGTSRAHGPLRQLIEDTTDVIHKDNTLSNTESVSLN